MLGEGAHGEVALGEGLSSTTTPALIQWFAPLSEPVRQKPSLSAGAQQFLAFNPVPVVPFGWMEPLSEPVRTRPGVRASAQQAIAFNPIPVVPFSWFSALSKPPVPTRPGLRPAQQQFLAFHPAPSPFVATGWFAPLSEPARFKVGLKPWLQQFFTGPPRLLPTPTATGTLSALETKDILLAGTSIFNPPASAEIGVVDTGFPAAEIGIAAPAVASVSISIQII